MALPVAAVACFNAGKIAADAGQSSNAISRFERGIALATAEWELGDILGRDECAASLLHSDRAIAIVRRLDLICERVVSLHVAIECNRTSALTYLTRTTEAIAAGEHAFHIVT